MATTVKTKAKKSEQRKGSGVHKASAAPASGSKAPDAIALLKQDHREVEGYFDEYEDTEDDKVKAQLSAKICLALKVHARIEEELFYPPARTATKDDDLLDEAVVEHAGAKELIAQIEAMKVGDDLYDAKITVLGEQIKHHVKEEEEELFPEVKATRMNLEEVGAQLAKRKAELMAQLSAEKPQRR